MPSATPPTLLPSKPRSRRRAAARARTVVLSALAFFLLLQGFLNVLLDFFNPALRDPEFGSKLSRLQKMAAAAPGRPVLLMLGSSRAMMCFDPDAAAKGDGPAGPQPVMFNAGATGGGPVMEQLFLRRVLAAGIRPTWVLVEVFPGILAREEERAFADRPERLSAAELAAVRPYANRRGALTRRWLGLRAVPCATLRFEVQHRLGLAWPAADVTPRRWEYCEAQTASGWWPSLERIDGAARQRSFDIQRDDYAQHLARSPIAPASDRALRDLLELCRREDIGVVLLWLPEGSDFRRLYGPQITVAAEAYFHGLAGEFGAGFVNARDWLPDDAFFDGHHPLISGAADFSRRLSREVIGPLVRDPTPR